MFTRVNILVFRNVHFRMAMKSINSFNNASRSTGVDKHPTEIQEEAKIRIHKHSCRRHYIKFWKANFSLWPLSSLSPVKNPPTPVDMSLSGSQSRSGSCGGMLFMKRIETRPSKHFTYLLRQLVYCMQNKHMEKSFIPS
jgi:hypothetical protein